MIKFYQYFTPALLLLLAEGLIERYVHDNIIRPYVGDFLVVVLIYCLIKSFINTPVLKTAVGVLLFAYAAEISQYYNLVGLLGLQNSRPALLLLGHSFSWLDMLCYTLGITLVIIIEKLRAVPDAGIHRPTKIKVK
jgi:DNA integrity scanning protein DisA with diadenylate cyclase activity